MNKYFNLFWLLLFFSCGKTFERTNPLDGKVVPTISGSQITSITPTTANITSLITSDGGASITNKGVTYSTNASLSGSIISTNNVPIVTGSFNNNLTGLIPLTTYYFRAFATNIVGTSYGPTISFRTTGSIPILTTTAISDTTATSARSGGNITSDGGLPITARGLVWSTLPAPTVALSTKTIDGTGIGIFSSLISGLTKNIRYYVRSYATNAQGTAYGNELSFLTNNVDLSNGLIAYYPFTGNANDISGNGYNGIVNGVNLTTDRFGFANNAYNFNGTSPSEIVINNNFINLASNFSISIWMKTSDVSKLNQCLFNSINHTGFVVEFNNNNVLNKLMYGVGNSVNFWDLIYGQGKFATFNSSNWYNVVFIKSGLTYSIYVNGILDGFSIVNRSSTYTSRVGLRIGSIGGTEIFKGTLDDVRVYNRALDVSEISYLSRN
jgi:hypothetical protein